MNTKKCILIQWVILASFFILQAQDDPYLWLEEVEGEKALAFVGEQSKATFDSLSKEKEYKNIYDNSLKIYNSPDKIPYPTIYGDFIYNSWKDKDHERGIWRRMSKTEYLRKDTVWEVLLDLDQMTKNDSIPWVFAGATGLYPKYDRFLVSLSKGGVDAAVVREFDPTTKSFLQDGFFIDEAKSDVAFLDENTVMVSTDFGENTMTTSGYARQVKLWNRGTLLKDAKLIYEGDSKDVGCFGYVLRDDTVNYPIILNYHTTFTGSAFLWMDDKAVKLDVPEDCNIQGILNNQLILDLKSDWEVQERIYPQGSLISLNLPDLLEGKKEIQLILQPDEFSSISQVSQTQNKLLVNVLRNVIGELHIYSFDKDKWEQKKVPTMDFGTIYIIESDASSDIYFCQYENFLHPSTLYVADATENSLKPYTSLPTYFDGSKYEVRQFKSTSKDGTLVPYFVVSAKNIKNDGNNPTLLYGYGGFEIPVAPFYAGTFGTSWLDSGGVFVLANIRGGGEYGPMWHQAGIKEKRQNVFDDFYSVAENLISKKITSPRHLGIMGGSNGGLLVGTAFTQRPELFNAVACLNPLLDMQRYSKLLAGASWIGEYGDPDKPEEWAYLQKYSPYQNLKKEVQYPDVYFFTATTDDRVHPGHARKMAAKMIDLGHKVYFYENTEGGHAGSSTNEQRATEDAMLFSYFLMKLN
ncbi:prolyl oligopeptidase [Pricia antarctica]|uniref:Prolyl oligopeptidase n=1 Tax=Pricia antarctica TaxID=641691 RepID=A0A1G7BB13_9FLAO|nr:prolyl oligopeptidase family serine peptidase [Pricia antarctica]SDE23526.1 prolyl oligopeptidase [Pricia antarctica]